MLIKQFEKIKSKGYIESVRKGNGSVGLTLERELGKKPEKSSDPDYLGIEIKAKKKNSLHDKYISLFNLGPEGNDNSIEYIKEKYGYPDTMYKKYKVFRREIFSNKYTYISGNKFAYKLEINKKEEKLYMLVYNDNFELIDNKINWSFKNIETRVKQKLSYLALFDAERAYILGKEYFKYTHMTIYKFKEFEKFIDLIKRGKIKITFTIGIHKDKEQIGKTYNHGTTFSISKKSLNELFEKIYEHEKIQN